MSNRNVIKKILEEANYTFGFDMQKATEDLVSLSKSQNKNISFENEEQLTKAVKKDLENNHGYDFDSDWFTDEHKVLVDDIIKSCILVIK